MTTETITEFKARIEGKPVPELLKMFSFFDDEGNRCLAPESWTDADWQDRKDAVQAEFNKHVQVLYTTKVAA